MTTTSIQDRINEQRATNLSVIAGWVEMASDGFLTADLGPHESLRIYRIDGEPLWLYEEMDGSESPVTGYLAGGRVYGGRKLNRTNKTDLRYVRDAVRTLLVEHFWNGEDGSGNEFRFSQSLDRFEQWAGIR